MSTQDCTCIFAASATDSSAGPFLDIGSMTTEEMRATLGTLTAGEVLVSYRRRILHARIDILRAELVTRLRREVPPES